MKSKAPTPFIYGSIPHSILRRAQQIKNPTAVALLIYLARQTFAFRRGSVDLTYSKIAEVLKVNWRTVATAAKRLEKWGDITREALPSGSYRWKPLIESEEIISDPDKSFSIRETPLPHDRSIMGGHDRSIMGGMIDRSWGSETPPTPSEPCQDEVEGPFNDPKSESLKKRSLKKTDLKKQHHGAQPEPMPAPDDDEPRHKKILRSLIKQGVSQRKARQLCRNFEHDLIEDVLNKVPTLQGIKNVPGYIVAEISDGGYDTDEQIKKIPGEYSHPRNYAHLTDHNVPGQRHKSVKPNSDAPKISPTVEQTRREQEKLERERDERSKSFNQQLSSLISRYKGLPEEIRAALETTTRAYHQRSLPDVASRERLAKDPAFKAVAIKSVLERFFRSVDDGLSFGRALQTIETKAVA